LSHRASCRALIHVVLPSFAAIIFCFAMLSMPVRHQNSKVDTDAIMSESEETHSNRNNGR
jgi:hypothetical protein